MIIIHKTPDTLTVLQFRSMSWLIGLWCVGHVTHDYLSSIDRGFSTFGHLDYILLFFCSGAFTVFMAHRTIATFDKRAQTVTIWRRYPLDFRKPSIHPLRDGAYLWIQENAPARLNNEQLFTYRPLLSLGERSGPSVGLGGLTFFQWSLTPGIKRLNAWLSAPA